MKTPGGAGVAKLTQAGRKLDITRPALALRALADGDSGDVGIARMREENSAPSSSPRRKAR